MIKNIILDVDGTIWNTTELVAKAWNQAIKRDGHSKVYVDALKLRTLFGKPMNIIASSLFNDVSPDICSKLLEDCCKSEQAALSASKADLSYPKVFETIKTLKEEMKKRLFIVSNCQSGYIELVLQKNQLEPFIEDFECFGNNQKQKADNIIAICNRNHLEKSETVYVGDTQGDYDATQQAGLAFVYAEYGFGSVTNAQYSIREFSELLYI